MQWYVQFFSWAFAIYKSISWLSWVIWFCPKNETKKRKENVAQVQLERGCSPDWANFINPILQKYNSAWFDVAHFSAARFISWQKDSDLCYSCFIICYTLLEASAQGNASIESAVFDFMTACCTILVIWISCRRNSDSLLVLFLSSTYLLQLLLAECM